VPGLLVPNDPELGKRILHLYFQQSPAQGNLRQILETSYWSLTNALRTGCGPAAPTFVKDQYDSLMNSDGPGEQMGDVSTSGRGGPAPRPAPHREF
jgi:hypothetical protein